MLSKIFVGILLAKIAIAQDFFNPHYATGKYGLVHLFEWHWDTIADECETFLGPKNVGGVQISPPTENRVVENRPWWERYQPISYDFSTRSGDRDSLADMISRCNAVGVRIYADIVMNHMCGSDATTGYGTGGTYYDATNEDFPGVPYTSSDFNAECMVNNYQDAEEVRDCRLFGLLDLDQKQDGVKGKIVGLMDDLISLGVAGFRIDACKYMWPSDLQTIFSEVRDLNSTIFGDNQRPFIYQEVIEEEGEPIRASDYSSTSPVTEFRYGKELAAHKDSLQYLGNIGESWGMLPNAEALVFINNHDNQRGHGAGGTVVEFQDDPADLKILTAYMLAYPYGIPRVMSSYYFSNSDEGPPASQRVVNSDGSCDNGWACEHRWQQIANMFEFGALVQGQPLENWVGNNNGGSFAFSRGNKGFLAVNKVGVMNDYFYTGLPDGSYCNIASGNFENGDCTGTCVTVNGGYANIEIDSADDDQVVAIHVNAMTYNCAS